MTKDQLAKANMIQTKIESISQTRKTIDGLFSTLEPQSSPNLRSQLTPKLYFKIESPKEPVFLDIPEVLTYKILDMTLSAMNSDLEKLEAEFKKI